MFKSEEHKLDKLEQELLDIEKVAKNLDLNSKDEDRMVLTNIVSETQNVPKDQSKNDLVDNLNNIKLHLNQQIKEIDNIIKSFDK
jgi:hypothetical protein|tara:strand:- start:307 stop:561 length:255 start_codon:yes stop_codon:yes gene_type:complete